jgi:hypothetical protein
MLGLAPRTPLCSLAHAAAHTLTSHARVQLVWCDVRRVRGVTSEPSEHARCSVALPQAVTPDKSPTGTFFTEVSLERRVYGW